MSYHQHRRQPERQRRTNQIILGAAFVGVAGLVISSCSVDESEQVTAVCVAETPAPDGTYEIVDDRYCGDSNTVVVGSSRSSYVYYYGGIPDGRRIRGGTLTRPPADVRVVTRTGTVIQRGGFGGHGGRGGGG